MLSVSVFGGMNRTNPGECIFVERLADQRRVQRSAIVDLGRGSGRAGQWAADKNPDIVVLTHDDDDHIGGWQEFHRGLIGRPELWIPADWFFVVLARRAWLSHSGVREQDGGQSAINPEGVTSALHGDHLSPPVGPLIAENEDGMDDFDAILKEPLGPPSEKQRKELAAAIGELRERGNAKAGIAGLRSLRDTNDALADRANKRSTAIAQIISDARHANLRIRWFDIDRAFDRAMPPWTTEGEPGLMTLVNAREIQPVLRTVFQPATTLFLMLRLSIQNSRALVSFAHSDDSPSNWYPDDSGFLIWSDSDGTTAGVGSCVKNLVPWCFTGMMTAPHHGSTAKSHDQIWQERDRIEKYTGSVVRVVNANNQRPTTDRLYTVPDTLRGCTKCGIETRNPRWFELGATYTSSAGWCMLNSCRAKACGVARGTCHWR